VLYAVNFNDFYLQLWVIINTGALEGESVVRPIHTAPDTMKTVRRWYNENSEALSTISNSS